MSGSLSLDGTWGLTWAEGSSVMRAEQFMQTQLRGRRLIPADVPAPIHSVLMKEGLLDDPNVGMNALRARWVEEYFWVYRHGFDAPAAALGQPAWLVFERLELDTVVLLNGAEIGSHANAHRPARFDVTGRLRAGENLLVVKISTGIHGSGDKPGADYMCHPMDMLTKRPWHRSPQYQFGWDWSPRLINVGILGDVRLEWCAVPRLGQVTVFSVCRDDLSAATVHARCMIENASRETVDGVLRLRVRGTVPISPESLGAGSARGTGTLPASGRNGDSPLTSELSLRIEPGESQHEVTVEIIGPRLWWPVEHGEPHLYTVEVELEAGGETQRATRRTGIRHVEIDQSPHPVEGSHFILKINHRPVFCRGGNWVPADLLYSTVTRERHQELVRLAREANFNMLRVWGGGVFADHALCEACDEAGVLIWHDFLFACSKYPGDDPAFAAEVRREVTWAARELAHHPSLVVWCGNNEIEWGDWDWGYDRTARTHPHYAMFHHDIPKIVAEEDPGTPHWISSPHSPGFKHPNDPTVGDQHPWGVSIKEPGGADFWLYRTYVDRFPNEGGVIGASSPATLRQFLPENERYVLSPSWEYHDNPFANMAAHSNGDIGRAYATVELWMGRDPLEMDWEAYAFASALLQAEGLGEYIANYRRRMFSSAAAIFWMYNDAWPATHGWTIVDYYRRRKLAYHPVRRAFQPVTVVVAEEGGEVTVHGVNDTREAWAGRMRYGVFTLAGERPMDATAKVEVAANASTLLARFPREGWEKAGLNRSGAFAVLEGDGKVVAQHRLFVERFKDLAFVDPKVEVRVQGGVLTCTCDAFAWGVCLDVDGERPIADNCFDLLPGIPYALPWPADLGQPEVIRVGSRDAVHAR